MDVSYLSLLKYLRENDRRIELDFKTINDYLNLYFMFKYFIAYTFI